MNQCAKKSSYLKVCLDNDRTENRVYRLDQYLVKNRIYSYVPRLLLEDVVFGKESALKNVSKMQYQVEGDRYDLNKQLLKEASALALYEGKKNTFVDIQKFNSDAGEMGFSVMKDAVDPCCYHFLSGSRTQMDPQLLKLLATSSSENSLERTNLEILIPSKSKTMLQYIRRDYSIDQFIKVLVEKQKLAKASSEE